MPEIDYQKWLKMDSLKVWQGIYLLLGTEPDTAEFVFERQTIYRDCEFMEKFERLADLAYASIKRGTLKILHSHREGVLFYDLIPSVFLHWAKKKEIDIPGCLLPILEEIAINKANADAIESVMITEIEETSLCTDTKPKLGAIVEETCSSALLEVIKDIFLTSTKITNKQMWQCLRKLGNQKHPIIQRVTSWSDRYACIGWISQNDNEQKMTKKRFSNYMSELRNPK